MKLLVVLSVLLLMGCTDEAMDYQGTEAGVRVTSPPVVLSEVETLLTAVELHVGLENFATAVTYFSQLEAALADDGPTAVQIARVNTMRQLLADHLVFSVVADYDDEPEIEFEERIFTGSDAAAKVMNMIGPVTGYTFVYHAIPSFVGRDGVGFYVFLVPIDHAQRDDFTIRERFFVTNAGEILVLE